MPRISKKLKNKTECILNLLDEYYGDEVICYLHYTKPYELLIATILSAQCTDERVNLVTADLFNKYTSLEDIASADPAEFENDIRSTGFYRNKAKNIIAAAGILLREYDSILPSDTNELTKLPGVGRKTANVVRTHIFNLPSIVVDTHVKRISKRWGLTDSDDPVKIEKELMDILPYEHWGRYNTQVIAHGRSICKAIKPKCDKCMFTACCDYYNNK